MSKNKYHLFIPLAGIVFLFASCVNNKADTSLEDQLAAACYPDDVGKIFITKCATPGCHNTLSREGSAGLDMSTWSHLFEGTNGGSAVIPFNAVESFLVNFINTDSTYGPVQEPNMPYNGTPLSAEEVQTVVNWINDGAPDCSGHRLTDNPDRKKFYITNQGCDLVSVWDAERQVIMRYIKVGGDPNLIESPHSVKISPDGLYWYVSFVANNARYFEKYRTSDDAFVGRVDIGVGSWNTFAFSPDSKLAYIVDFNTPGKVAYVDCETMTLRPSTPFNPEPGTFNSPHGSAVSPDGHYLYMTMQLGNALYKMDISSFPPDGQYVNFSGPVSRPHEIVFSPNGLSYYVTCEATNDVKVFNAQNDQFITSIPTGVDPVEMSLSLSHPYLFVSCMGGNAVSIINYTTNTLIKTIDNSGFFYYPHGIVVDDAKGVCYVSNRNLEVSGGPPPHHTSVCGGRNGFLLAIRLSSLEVISGFKKELSVDPYGMTIRK